MGGGGGQRLGGWSTVGGGSSTSTNRSSHHKYKTPKRFELKQSWKALRALNARWSLPVYPFLRTKSQKRQTKTRSSEKSHRKRLRLRAIKNITD